MSDTNFMSYSDAETVVTGIADKYKTFKGTQAQWDALSLADKVKYSFADITDDYAGTGVVDAVTNGDMNPVTSNAVYDYLNDSVTVTPVEGDSAATLLSKLRQATDYSRLNERSTLLVTMSETGYPANIIMHISRIGSSQTEAVAFEQTYLGYGRGYIHHFELLYQTTAHIWYIVKEKLSDGTITAELNPFVPTSLTLKYNG